MNNIKKFGYFCLGIVFFIEIGSIIGNLLEGESLFYLFDIRYKFSLDNNFFIPYWGSLIGLIFLIREVESIDDFDKIFETLRGKSEPPHRNSTSSSYKTKLNFDEFPRSDIPSKTDQRFQQFLRERGLSYLESRERWERYWKHQYLNWNPQPKPLELSKNFNQFLNEKNISLDEFKKNPPLWINEYEQWLKRK